MQSLQFRKPELIPLLFIIGAVTLLTGLGIWQVERLEWKRGIIAGIIDAQNKPTIKVLSNDVTALSYRNAELTGRYVGDEFHVVGQKVGGYVWLAPFRTNNGKTLLVSLGWFPIGAQVKPMSSDEITVKGILRPPHGKRLFAPDNQPEKNLWFTEDIMAMSQRAGVTLMPIILDHGTPILRNDHLEYAITWFSLAIIAVVMFALYYRKPAA